MEKYVKIFHLVTSLFWEIFSTVFKDQEKKIINKLELNYSGVPSSD